LHSVLSLDEQDQSTFIMYWFFVTRFKIIVAYIHWTICVSNQKRWVHRHQVIIYKQNWACSLV